MSQARVNHRIYETYTDDNGELRFQPNRIVTRLLDETSAGFDQRKSLYDMNRMRADYINGGYTLAEMIELHINIGYTVDGFLDVLDSLVEQNPDPFGPSCIDVIILD